MIVDEIISVAKELGIDGSFHQLSSKDAELAIFSAESKFVTKPGLCWWWQSLKIELPLKSFAGAIDVEQLIPSICPDQKVWLFASDDEFQPWPVFTGRPIEIAKVISHCYHFEYLLVSPSLEWAIIENHHNTLFAIGEPVASQLEKYVMRYGSHEH